MSSFAGVIYTDRHGSIVHLPLEEVNIDALIVDVSARVTIQQIFSNPSRTASARAKYVFPLPARAAVCAFEMRSGDHTIIGKVKEKTQASAEHEEAIQQGKRTALVEWATDDIFTISLGSIPGDESVTTITTYVMDLMDDECVQRIRFQIPVCVGQRYGQIPLGMADALEPSHQTRIRFHAIVQTKGRIRPEDVSSLSHPKLTVSAYQTHASRPSRHRISVKFRSRQFLVEDFVLRIKAAGLGRPRCFVEHDSRGTVAMQLTLMPEFELPPIAAQEYLFLVDRSGSMEGSRIDTAKTTLGLLLRALPSRGTVFNIFSFGSRCDAIWQTSVQYTQDTLAHATALVDMMSANYGGTEIRAALRTTLQSRDSSRPTALFVFTDGESYDIDGTIQLVATFVARAPPSAPLRVFALGIGSTASSAMCEGIARVGNGVCLMTMTPEGILGKCMKLLRAGRTFLLKNITIDWGISPSAQDVDGDGSPSVRFTAMDQIIRQAPSHIESIHPGLRQVVFAIIKSDKFVVPGTITLRAQRDGTGDPLQFSIPVEHVRINDENVRNGVVHTLAVRRLIMELDDPALSQCIPHDERVASIVRLGEQYQLASRYTSFVAVEGVEPELMQRRAGRGRGSAFADRGDGDGYVVGAVTEFVKWLGSPLLNWTTQSGMPGADVQSRPASLAPSHDEGSDDGHETDNTFTTLSSLEQLDFSDWSDTESRPPSPPPDDPEYVRSPSPDLVSPPERQATAQEPTPELVPPPLDDSVEGLVRLQSFDGSFLSTSDFVRIVGQEALEEGRRLQLDDKLWATILAIEYFKKHLVGHPELLDSLVEKALEYAYEFQDKLPPRLSIPQLLYRATNALA